MNIYRWQISDI